jgi:AraC-like DNA-binding protein
VKSSKPEISPATLRIGATIGVPEVLRDLGADPVEVLNEVGVGIELFDDANNRISFNARGRMMAHCAERTGCPHFGLLVGQKAGLASFGLVGLLARHSPDVEMAIKSLVRFMHLHVRGATTNLTEDSGCSLFEYQIYQKGALGNDQVGAGAVAVAYNILRELCGDDWVPVEVRFAHGKPKNIAPFRSFFRAPLNFDSEQYAVAFSKDWLSRRVSESSPELLELLQREIDKLDVREAGGFEEQVRTLLRTTLVSGHASASQLAELLSMNRRTLNRRLNAHGTSFQKLVDEISFEIARQLLEDTAMGVVQISMLLGYSNASAFTRAFRRWSNTTPAKWRANTTGAQ